MYAYLLYVWRQSDYDIIIDKDCYYMSYAVNVSRCVSQFMHGHDDKDFHGLSIESMETLRILTVLVWIFSRRDNGDSLSRICNGC